MAVPKSELIGYCDCCWTEISAVTADKERGQIVAHSLTSGIIAEFPIGRTVLTCQKPLK